MRKIKKLLALILTVVMITLTVAVIPVHAAGDWDEINHRLWVTCNTCGGSGSKKESCPKTATYTCSSCNGTGSYSYSGNCSSSCTKGSQYYPCPGVLPGGSVCTNWEAGTYCSGHYKGAPCGSSSNHSGTVTNCPLKVTSTCTTCSGTGTKTVSCSTGAYQYDTIAPTLSLTKSIDADSPSYAGQAVTVTATASDNLSGVYQYQFGGGSWQSSNTFTVLSTVGSVTVTCSVKDNAGNVSNMQSIAVKTMLKQSSLVITAPNTIVYGETVNLFATGGTTGNTVVWSVRGNATIDSNGKLTTTSIGDVVAKATMSGNANYFDVESTVNITIVPKPISTTGTITVSDKVYDGNVTVPLNTTLNLVGVVGDDDIMLDKTVATFVNSNVGTDKSVTISPLTFNGADSSNYTLSQPILTGYKANITQKELTVDDIEVSNKVYDNTTNASYVNNPSLVGVVEADDVLLQNGTPSFLTATKGKDKNLGFLPFKLSGSKSNNYLLTQPVLGTADITALAVTITDFEVKDKVYDATTNAQYLSTPQLNGVLLNDDAKLIFATPSFNSKDVGNKVVSHSVFEIIGVDADNYSVIQPNKTSAKITQKTLKVTDLLFSEKEYDTTTNVSYKEQPALLGLCLNDDVNLVVGKATFENANVGKGKNIITESFLVEGNDVDNYNFETPSVNGYFSTVISKSIFIRPNTVRKTYGDIDPKLTYTHDDFLEKEIAIRGDLKRTSGENAGVYDYDITNLMTTSNNYILTLVESNKFVIGKNTGYATLVAEKTGKTGKVKVKMTVSSETIEDALVSYYIAGAKVGESKMISGKADLIYTPISVGKHEITAIVSESSNFDGTNTNSVFLDISKENTGVFDDSQKDDSIIFDSVPDIATEVEKKGNPSLAVDKENSSVPTNGNTTPSSPTGNSNPKEKPAIPNIPLVVDNLPPSIFTPLEKEEITKKIEDAVKNNTSAELVIVDVSSSSNIAEYNSSSVNKVVGLYNAKLLLDGVEVLSNQQVIITIPVPEGSEEKYEVYRLMEDGSLVKVEVMSATAKGVSFETGEMGTFVLCLSNNVSNSHSFVFLIAFIGVALLITGILVFIFIKRHKKDVDNETN